MALEKSTPILCPYCGECIEIDVDISAQKQDYVEDCQVCCQPILLHIIVDETGEAIVDAEKEND